jgi:hypothetical protein
MRGAEAHDYQRDFHLILTAFLRGDRRCPGPRYIRLAGDDDILTAFRRRCLFRHARQLLMRTGLIELIEHRHDLLAILWRQVRLP